MPFAPLTRVLPAVVLAVIFAGLVEAEEPAANRDAQLFAQLDANADGQLSAEEIPAEHQRLFQRLLRRGDADGSGRLSSDEFFLAMTPSTSEKPIEQRRSGDMRGADATRLLLIKLDTNGDTRLTRAEAPEALRGVFDRLVESMDVNKDGELARNELARFGPRLTRQAQQIARNQGWNVDEQLQQLRADESVDADRFDRQLDPRRTLGDPKQAAELFKQLDANRDGQLVEDELPAPIQQRLGRLLRRADTDQSGGVSQAEFVRTAGRLSRFLQLSMGVDRAASDRPKKSETTGTDAMADSMAMASGDSPAESASSESTRANAPHGNAQRLARRLIERLDRDGDGIIARSEARGRLAERFDDADLNGDGQLGPGEQEIVVKIVADRLRNAGQ
ncbi:MAG: hypothetical protein AAGF31_08985 [Planctomycetota bacterium]